MSDQSQPLQEHIKHNDELENYFRNTIISQLYVDGSLKLRKFTPPAMSHFTLSEKHIGKPLIDIKDNVPFPNIEDDVKHVINSNEILEKEIQTTDLRWYQIDIVPYVKGKENSIDGVVITFVEITRRIRDLKKHQKLIAENAHLLNTATHDLRNSISNLMVSVELLKSMTAVDEKEFNSILEVVDKGLVKMNTGIIELTESFKLPSTN